MHSTTVRIPNSLQPPKQLRVTPSVSSSATTLLTDSSRREALRCQKRRNSHETGDRIHKTGKRSGWSNEGLLRKLKHSHRTQDANGEDEVIEAKGLCFAPAFGFSTRSSTKFIHTHVLRCMQSPRPTVSLCGNVVFAPEHVRQTCDNSIPLTEEYLQRSALVVQVLRKGAGVTGGGRFAR